MSKERLYIAGQWGKRAAIRETMEQLKTQGYTIVHDWTQHAESEGKTQEQYKQEADRDIAAIRTADRFIAFMEDIKYPYRGTFGEINTATALGIPVIIVTPYTTFDPKNVYFHSNTFTWQSGVALVRTLEEALAL